MAFCVISREKLPQVGELSGHVGKGGIVGDVPVEHVILVHLHQVKIVLNNIDYSVKKIQG
jgi:hypothetical protein